MNLTNPSIRTWIVYRLIEILVGLLVLATSIIDFYPFRFFGIRTGAQILIFSYVILGMLLLVIGVFRLVSVFWYELTGLTKAINIVTSLVTIIASIIILFFQMIATGQNWFHFLFGIGLLSYAIGRVTIGALANEYNIGLRVFFVLIGFTISIFVIIVSAFQLVHINAGLYFTYSYFAIIAFTLIGIDCLASAIVSILLKKFTTIDKEK